MLKKIVRSKYFTIFLHISVWMIIFLLPWVLRPGPFSHADIVPQRFPPGEHFQVLSTLMNISFIPLFYLNAFLLVPRFFNKKRWYVFLLFVVISVAILAEVNVVIRHLLSPAGAFPFPAGIIIFLSIFILVTSTAFYYIRQNVQMEKLRLKTELSFLRSQVSPHFLFNTLNNLVSLARKKSDLLEPSLLKLSGLLQYMLYESDDEKISIHKEIEYLNNYIELQKLRFGSEVKTDFIREVPGDSAVEIVPMILVPFVENAFKHGTAFIREPEISIRMNLTGRLLTFTVRNKFNPAREEQDKSSGIGLINVQRRLNLLYPESRLEIFCRNDWYIVTLSISL